VSQFPISRAVAIISNILSLHQQNRKRLRGGLDRQKIQNHTSPNYTHHSVSTGSDKQQQSATNNNNQQNRTNRTVTEQNKAEQNSNSNITATLNDEQQEEQKSKSYKRITNTVKDLTKNDDELQNRNGY